MILKAIQRHFLVVVSLIAPSLAFSQAKGVFFHHLSTKEGLSQANNAYVFHDSRGFVWISSIDGLNRFDGLGVRVYRPDTRRPRSMKGQNILSPIFEDDHGDLWFCTYEAINCYRRRTDDFEHWQIKNPSTGDTIREGYYTFYFDQKNRLWLRLGETPKDGRAFLFDTRTARTALIGALYGNRCVVDTNSTGTVKGIYAFEYNLANSLLYRAVLSNGTLDEPAKANPIPALKDIWKANDTLVWLASSEGLLAFNPVSNGYRTYNLKGVVSQSIRAIEPLGGTQLAISTNGAGLWLFDTKNYRWGDSFRHQQGLNTALSSDYPNDLYLDADQNLWVSDWEFGLNFYNRNKAKVAQLVLSDLNVWHRPMANSLQGLAEDAHGQVWCATESGGLYVFDRKRAVRQIYKMPGWPVSDILHLLFDRNNVLWLVTPQGLFWCESSGKRLHFLENSQRLHLEWGGFLSETVDGRLLLATTGLHEIKRKANGYLLAPQKIDPLVDDALIPFFYQSGDGTFFMNVNAAETIVVRSGDKPRKLPLNNLKACYEDPNGQDIWLATTYGLAKVDKQTLRYRLFDESWGLPNQYLYAVIPDKDSCLWLSSNKGILRFDPRTETVRALTTADGVWGNEFYTNVWLRTRTGEIWMGNRDVLNIFNPEQIRQVPALPKIQVTGLKVNDLPWQSDVYIGETNSLNFGYTDNTLSFEFVALEYSDPTANRLSYHLKGYDNDTTWLECQAGVPGFARYANLPPGHYVFQIRAANSDGVWAPALRELSIDITPPFWKEWWFNPLIFVVILALAYGLYRYRIQQIRTQFSLRQRAQENELKAAESALSAKESALKAAESEMTALRAQMNPHFIFNSLNSINAFILRNEGKMASAYLTEFSRLIRQILDNSTRESISVEDEIEFLESYLKTESLRLQNKLTYDIRADENMDVFDTQIPSMILQPYVENALWHGISPKQGRGHLSIRFKKEADGTLLLVVEDDGIGREKARALKLQQLGTHQSKGLKITQERLALYDQKRGGHSTITTLDQKDETGTAIGTLVEVRIYPVKH